MGQAHLGRAEHMAGGVQAHAHRPEATAFAIVQGFEVMLAAQAVAQNRHALVVGPIAGAAGAGVIGVGVGDHGPGDRSPGVDVEVSGGAVEALPGRIDQRVIHVRDGNNAR